jgi:hypothetical protein
MTTTLLTVDERCLRTRNISPSRFGRQAAHDPRFVFDLRRGRESRAVTQARVLAYIANPDAGSANSGVTS